MFSEVFRFEMLYRLKRPLFYIFAAFFFVMTFTAISTDSVALGGSIGNVARNSPYVIINMLILMSTMGLLFVTIFVAPSVNRDHEENIQEIFFSTPLRKGPYLAGRYLGSVMPVAAAMVFSCLGIYIASIMPYQNPDKILPFSLWPYLYSLLVFIIPNLLLTGAIFFSIATLSRKVMYAYAGVVAFFCLWGAGLMLMRDLDHTVLASLLDPFGWGAFKVMTRYWTISERNASMLSLSGLLLTNRILWLAAAAAVMAWTFARYRMALPGRKGSARAAKEPEESGALPAAGRMPAGAPAAIGSGAGPSARTLPAFALDFSARAVCKQYLHQSAIETVGIVRSIPFIVILMFGAANLFGSLFMNPDGTTSYPLTQHMINLIQGSFELMPWLFIIIYGAEIVWKDRRYRINEIVDSLPVPGSVVTASKLTALFAVSLIMMLVALTCTVAFQALNGYFRFEPALYFKGLFLIMLTEWFLLCVLSLFLQAASGNRYLGTLLMVGWLVAQEVLKNTGHGHRLYLYGQVPPFTYSDMNGYGHFAPSIFWFKVYWSLFAAGLVILSSLLWIRGTDRDIRPRLRIFRIRLGKRPSAALAVVSACFILTGAWIFYNTNILNEYRTEDEENRITAEYERRYKKYEGVPQPKVTAAALEVDVFPESRKVEIGGSLLLVNKTEAPVDSLHLNIDSGISLVEIGLPGADLLVDDRETGYRIYALDPPLAPGDSMRLGFDLTVLERGFENGGTNVRIVENGTFFTNLDYVPIVGYWRSRELQNPDNRRKAGLPEKPGKLPADDPAGLASTFIPDADRISFEAVVSTSPDQTALAPGHLEREWTDRGRRYFRYRMDHPMLNLYCFVSGRYDAAREIWNGIPVEIFHHGPHGMNVPRMIEAVKKSLDYYTSSFTPYPDRQIRIIEFPGYRRFAQSFPSTIPFSESASFVDDLRKERNIDYVFYITAHEVAHQWFAHQVTPADIEGGEMITESMSQYCALMVMEKDFGPERMMKFLRYELDQYLTGRSKESREEKPLMHVGAQPYIYYNKGSLVMYALRDYIGEEAFNGAVRRYVDDEAYKGPPYASSIGFMPYIREAVPEEYSYLVEDLFETITLYDNRAERAAAERTDDGKYRVTLSYVSRKMRADGRGVETEIPHNDWIEIAVYGGSDEDGAEKTLYREKRRISSGEGTIEIIVDEPPARAGIDPRNMLIDRIPGDNVTRVAL